MARSDTTPSFVLTLPLKYTIKRNNWDRTCQA